MIMYIDPDPKTILDVGPGAGQWFELLKSWYPEATFDAVEIFEPYVTRYRLREKYDSVIVEDVRKIAAFTYPFDRESPLKIYDLVIFGDVIEHMAKPDAIKVVDRLLTRHALISIPIGECPQDGTEENPFEEHVATWDHLEIINTFPVAVSFHEQYPPPHYGRGIYLLEKR